VARRPTPQALFGIVQGGEYRDLRENSARVIGSLPFDGVAIGGSLGKSKADMHAVLDWTVPLLPKVESRLPSGLYRASAKFTENTPTAEELPAATILPSD
jgi:tRNA-guanine family transglycosylase